MQYYLYFKGLVTMACFSKVVSVCHLSELKATVTLTDSTNNQAIICITLRHEGSFNPLNVRQQVCRFIREVSLHYVKLLITC